VKKRIRSCALLVCGLAFRVAAAQDSLRFTGPDPETTRQVSQIVESAAAAGLPASHIVAKAQFAVLVRTPAPRIVETAKAVAARLEIARQSIAPHKLANDIVNAEEALSYNVPPDVLRQISKASPEDPIAVPLSVLTSLVASRVPLKRASEIVTDLIRHRATSAQMVALGKEVEADVRTAGFRALDAANLAYSGLIPHLAPLSPTAATATDAGLSASSPPKKP
jgi:hypothetical protein